MRFGECKVGIWRVDSPDLLDALNPTDLLDPKDPLDSLDPLNLPDLPKPTLGATFGPSGGLCCLEVPQRSKAGCWPPLELLAWFGFDLSDQLCPWTLWFNCSHCVHRVHFVRRFEERPSNVVIIVLLLHSTSHGYSGASWLSINQSINVS